MTRTSAARAPRRDKSVVRPMTYQKYDLSDDARQRIETIESELDSVLAESERLARREDELMAEINDIITSES